MTTIYLQLVTFILICIKQISLHLKDVMLFTNPPLPTSDYQVSADTI